MIVTVANVNAMVTVNIKMIVVKMMIIARMMNTAGWMIMMDAASTMNVLSA